MNVVNTIPVIPVENLKKSLDFYVGLLGFKKDWSGIAIGSVSRDGHSIMLSELTGAQGPGWVWMGVRDASLFDEYRAKGVRIHQEPKNYIWAYEMKFEDPDGNILWLGTESRKDLPVVE